MRKPYLAIVFLSLIFSIFLVSTVNSQDQKPQKKVVVGDILTSQQYDLILTSLDGKTVTTLGQITKNKVAVINFWAFWCPPCIGEMPSLQRLYDQYRKNPKIVFVFAAIDNSNHPDPNELKRLQKGYVASTNAMLKELKLQLPVYVASTREAQLYFAIDGIPTTLIVDKNGKVVVCELDQQDWDTPETVVLLNKLISQ